MRRAGRNLAAKLVSIFVEPVRAHGDVALEVVPHEINLLDVALEEHLLDLGPFYLLRIGPAVVEQQPTYAKDKNKVKPREIESHADNLPSWIIAFRRICVIRHLSLSFLF